MFWRRFPALLLLVCAVAGVSACAPRVRRSPSRQVVYSERGLASWYGKKFHGRKTANGERYNMYGVSAAHRTLPMGTFVTVTHEKSGRALTVRINDRGPFVEGRIIDLSLGAARKLGTVREGVAPVRLEVFGTGPGSIPSIKPVSFTVQVGSFEVKKNAEDLAKRLKKDFPSVFVSRHTDNKTTYYRVRTGHFSGRDEAAAEAGKLKDLGHHPLITAED